MLSKNSKSESTNHHHVRQIQEQNQNSEHPGISSVEIQQPSGRILLEIRGICWKVAISWIVYNTTAATTGGVA